MDCYVSLCNTWANTKKTPKKMLKLEHLCHMSMSTKRLLPKDGAFNNPVDRKTQSPSHCLQLLWCSKRKAMSYYSHGGRNSPVDGPASVGSLSPMLTRYHYYWAFSWPAAGLIWYYLSVRPTRPFLERMMFYLSVLNTQKWLRLPVPHFPANNMTNSSQMSNFPSWEPVWHYHGAR